MRLRTWGGEQERTAIGELGSSLDEDAESRRIDELHRGQIDHEPVGSLRSYREQGVPDGRRVVEIELPGQSHHYGAVRAVDACYRMVVQAAAGRFVHAFD